MNDLIIIGAGGHARSCIDVIESSGKYKIVGAVDNDNDKKNILGYPIIGNDKDLPYLREKYQYAFIAIGQILSAESRVKIFNYLNKLNFILPTIISPLAHISQRSKIESGTIVMHYALINANVKIGKNCIINTKALVEHDAVIENHCHISTGSIINGGVKVNKEVFIGSGSVLKNNLKIGKKTVIGSGLSIKRNIDKNKLIK